MSCKGLKGRVVHECSRSFSLAPRLGRLKGRPAVNVLRAGRLQSIFSFSAFGKNEEKRELVDANSEMGLYHKSTDAAQKEGERMELLGVAQFMSIAVGSFAASYYAHPYLLDLLSDVWDLKQTTDSSYENSFFSMVGVLYGLLTGNTFLFLYERQVNIVQELYGEAFALELLVQQTFFSLPDQEARVELSACVRHYISDELYYPVDMASPFAPGSPFTGLVKVICDEKERGYDVSRLVEATQKLADAQSRRSAVAAQVLPYIHGIFLLSLQLILILCFLVFAASAQEDVGGVSVERQLAFSALVAVLVLTHQVLVDLENPVEGLYSFKRGLDGRMTYVFSLLHQLEHRPTGYIPPELQRLETFLGMVSSMSHDTEMPSTAQPMKHGRHGRNDAHTYAGGAYQTIHNAIHEDHVRFNPSNNPKDARPPLEQ